MFATIGVALLFGSLSIGLAVAYLTLERRRMREAMERKVRKRTSLVRAAAHELRQPLNGIVGLLGHMRSAGIEPGVGPSTTGRIEKSIRELNGALVNTLEIFDLAGGELIYNKEPVELRTEALLLIRRLNRQLRKGKAPLLIQAGYLPEFWVEADPTRVRQCLTTLINQAVSQTSHGRVLVSFRVEKMVGAEHKVTFLVKDNGRGMDQHRAQRFFDPLEYEENPALRGRPAAMLALNLAQQIAKQMGGTISAHSRMGSSTTFFFSFLADTCPAADTVLEDKLEETSIEAALPTFEKMSVLLVDDNELNLFVLEEFVLPLNFGRVVSVKGGQAAIDRAANEPFDLILTDLAMPDVDGITAARTIREGGASAGAQIVAVSAEHRHTEDPELIEAGIRAFVPKPVVSTDLMAAVAKLTPAMLKQAQARSAANDGERNTEANRG